MDSITRQLTLLYLGLCAAALAACSGPTATQCEATGILCPQGSHCAAAQPICISDMNLCGNAHLDQPIRDANGNPDLKDPRNEICDDGNNIDGDGCSADCRSDETCGNGHLDQPIKINGILDLKDPRNEDCDTPLQLDPKTGIFCSAVCKFEKCGNGVMDMEIGEQCDDGNTVGGDGCSADCKWVERCGNGHTDQPFRDSNGNPDLNDPRNEICDDGNNIDGDGCASDCRSTENCGNGKIDPGEECDDGKTPEGVSNNANDRDCRADCTINRCGDGFANTHGSHREACDGAPQAPVHDRTTRPTETAICNADCTAPRCGDGIVNQLFSPSAEGHEQCDPPSVASGCSANCRFEHCGNSVVDPGEQCDDGNNARGDGCFDCRFETCGNGRVDPGEQCDDGNNASGDGCSGSTSPLGACVIEFCGDSVVNDATTHTHEQCDTAGINSATCNFNCTMPVCGDGIVNSLFSPSAEGVEQCDPPSVATGCSARCRFEHCGNGVVDPGEQCDDGNTTKGDGCFDCRFEACGNGRVDPGEQCDDGNSVSGDGCSGGAVADGGCRIEFCGDTVTNNANPQRHTHEDCDDGGINSATCNFNCTTATCGDGIVNPQFTAPGAAGPEQCDPPSEANGCSATCRFEHCGNGVKDPGEECDGNDFGSGGNPNGFTCAADCHIQQCGNGRVDPGEQCDDGNNTSGDGCSGSTSPLGACRIEFCGDTVTNNANAQRHTHEDCDDGGIDSATCNFNCTTATCGDGIVNPLFTAPGAAGPEQCDPPSEAKGCSTDCRFEHCGNHVKDPGEECDGTDFGPDGNPDALICAADCHIERCGNGRLDPGEQCDDGNSVSGDGCTGGSLTTGGCVFEFCGDHVINNTNTTTHVHEDCDDGGLSATCNLGCTTARCGDSIVNPLFTAPGADGPEQCDPPSEANGCSATCRFEHCGNHVKDPGEECDGTDFGPNGNPLGTLICSASCHIQRCGNGILDPGEQCDDGNNVSGDGCSGSLSPLGACVLEVCGDSVPNNNNPVSHTHEDCDSGGVNRQACNFNCTTPACGDGIVNPAFTPLDAPGPEQCDPPSETNGCSASCQFEHCGNGIKDPGEECDLEDFGPAGNPGNFTCAADCHIQRCGNRRIDPGEECDDGNTLSFDGCSSSCIIEFCGDGIPNNNNAANHTHEACDDGGVSTTCNANCTAAHCGDGIVNPLFVPLGALGGEQCDPPSPGHGCSITCQFEHCGNGIKDPGEECDLDDFGLGGNPDGTLVCSAECHIERCGNGRIDPGEACDDGNADACGTCSDDCKSIISAAAATGLLLTPPGSAYHEGDFFILDDGLTMFMVTFTKLNISGPGIIQFDGTETTTQMADQIANTIRGSGLRIDPVVIGSTGIVTLANRQPTTKGNQHTANMVTAVGFFLSDLAGGKAGDCANATGCLTDTDCLSYRCDRTTQTCAACTVSTDCSTNLCVGSRCQVCTQDGECGGPGHHCTNGVCQ